ncbi:MAG: VOC family protein [Acidobacteriaceae bacterium]
MTNKVRAIPEGYHTMTPYLVVQDGAQQIEFLKQAFGGTQRYRMDDENGEVRHAEVLVGNSHVMVAQERGEWKAKPASFYLYTEDCDAWYKSALAAGATSTQEPTDHAYGDRSAGVKDGNGNDWWIATHVEDVTSEEMERRMKAGQK